jgi:GAF domain
MKEYTAERERYARKVQDEINGYTAQLAADNEAFRILTASLRSEIQRLRDQVAALRDEQAANEARERELREQLLSIEGRHEETARARIQMERRNAELTHLYVACHRLHESPRRDDLLLAMEEILASIVGCEQLGFYELDDPEGGLTLIRAVGDHGVRPSRAPLGAGRIGATAESGNVYVAPGGVPGTDGISACVPLLDGDRVIGAIALFELLAHKRALGDMDREVFEILAHQGGAAFLCSGQREQLDLATAQV